MPRQRAKRALALTAILIAFVCSTSLASSGQIHGGQSLTVLRNGAQMSINNEGDTITRFSPGNQARDSFTYAGSTEGVRDTTNH